MRSEIVEEAIRIIGKKLRGKINEATWQYGSTVPALNMWRKLHEQEKEGEKDDSNRVNKKED